MRRHKLLSALVIVVICIGGWATLHHDDTPQDAAPPGTAGFIATTGDPNDPNAGKDLGDAAVSTSAAGLVETPSDVPGGGMVVDLQGRFRSSMAVTVVDSDSTVVICSPDSAPGGGR
ncbi:MAG TPA: hypothetical protein PLQ13_00170 [Candidatus Krumholzibacteria bacterium]|nr:hypothetical protein [Candidatus Krumholzibacteria bacterium]